MKQGEGFVIVWADILGYSADPIIKVHCNVIARAYVRIFGDHVHPIVQTSFPGFGAIYQYVRASDHKACGVHSWFDKNADVVSCLSWPPQ